MELHIYGAYVPDHLTQFHSEKEGFIIKGTTEDALKTIGNSRVLLAPLLFGAGIKGKLTDAMLAGTPSVTTEIGAEGIRGDFPWNGFIIEDAADFAEKAVMLYTNETLWKEKQLNGVAIINSKFDGQKLETSFFRDIEKKMQSLDSDRRSNFMGSLLNYEKIKATKYMSKWIEEKNK